MARMLVILALLLAVAGCGDDDSDGEIFTGVDGEDPVVDQVPDDEEVDLDDPAGADDELIGAIEAYARTQIEGDPDELVQARSQGCAVLETDLDTDTHTAGSEEPSVSDVEAEVDGDEATVSYRVDPGGEQIADERWVREDGEWKWDNC